MSDNTMEESGANGEGINGAAEKEEQMEGQETTEMDDSDEDERKLFIGGLSWETTAKDLKDYFGKFGEVENCTLKTDMETRRSRGFGFIVFKEVETVEKILLDKTHKLHGREIDPKRANPRIKEEIKKVFVGRLEPTVTEDELKEYFGKYGKVEAVDLPFDKLKGVRRNFAFVEFENEKVVETVLAATDLKLGGKDLDVKKATPSQRGGGGRGGGRGFPRGGRGGGRGFQAGGYGGGYGGGYDNYGGYAGYGGYGGYAGYAGNYGGYGDYNYGPGGGWGGYDAGYYGSYGGGGYDNWYGPDQSQQSGYGKSKRGGGGGGGNYHPYQR